jgi:hypothetical protein
MAATNSEILEQYRLARDAILTAIAAGNDVVEYRIGSRSKRVTDPVSELRFVEEMIERYESKVNATSGRARNLIRLRRR